VFSHLRCLLEEKAENQVPRYCILRKPKAPVAGVADFAKLQAQFDRDSRLLPHRIADLGRFNIDVLLIDEYREIEDLLRKLCLATSARNIFVSGSAHDYAPSGREKVERFCRKLGEQIIHRGYNLVSGFGLGIAGACIIGAHEQAKREKAGRIGERLRLHPFPQEFRDDAERRRVWGEIRTELVRESGVTVFIAGNKLDSASGRVVVANGVLDEFALARANSHVLIPVAATGGAAAQIWGQMRPSLADFFGTANVGPEFALLEDGNKSEGEWVEAIFTIINKARTR